ncbi:ornithine decarboxylase 1-like [Halictus rubicundus]|uniref:ornithine decarboxylase 1-like n=1 Tax=Halictus rubicundus TaxID=77578 RepID=UPI0040369032
MSRLSVDDVELFEDTLDDFGIIRTIIKTGNEEESFYIVDIADVVQKYKDWIAKIPQVTPYYAIKCNPDPTVIKTLASLNAGFDCASEQEIKDILVHGIPVNRIIFANPTKLPSHIKFARKVNVDRLTVDSEAELVKIKAMFPEAKIVIRIQCDAENSEVCLGTKFGCNPDDEAIHLIHLTKNLGLTLHGLSFHVGSPCGEVDAYGRGIATCKRLIAVANSIGVNIKLIDIGGGFPGVSGFQLDSFATVINEAIKDLDPGIEIISEPGRYFVTSSFTLASYLHSKKLTFCKGKEIRMYHVTCGVYTSFIEELLKLKARIPIPLEKPDNDETFLSTLWGPTCDSLDCILQNVMLPEVEIGSWLIWRDMGAYSISLCSPFNGFKPPKVYPFVRKSQWNDIDAYIKSIQNSGKVD